METVIAWMLAFMVSVAPPGRKTYYAEAQELKTEALTRYRSIAEDVTEVVYDPNTKPLFRGKKGRTRTVSVILAIMLYESGFMKNVDYGIGKYGRGDNGKSWCLMQMMVGKGRAWQNAGGWNVKYDRPPRFGDDPKDIEKGSSGPEMVKDRRLCVKEALRLLRISFVSCRHLPLNQRLRVYASGSCKGGAKGSALRLNTAIKFFNNSYERRKNIKDTEISKLVVAKIRKRKADEAAAAIALAKKQKAKKEKKLVAKNDKKPSAKKPTKKSTKKH
jgi:hypothetical protein